MDKLRLNAFFLKNAVLFFQRSCRAAVGARASVQQEDFCHILFLLVFLISYLRHTYAVLSLQNGDDVKTVQTNLGHASAAFTLDVYGHVSDRMQRASADRMEEYIASISRMKSA